MAVAYGSTTVSNLTDIIDVYFEYALAVSSANVTNSYVFDHAGELGWTVDGQSRKSPPAWREGYKVWAREVKEKRDVVAKEYGDPFIETAINETNEELVRTQYKLRKMWCNEDGSFMASGIGTNDVDTTDSSTYGYNSQTTTTGINLNYNDAGIIVLDSTTPAIKIFRPPTITQSTVTRGIEALNISTNGLVFYEPSVNRRKAIELTTSALAIYDPSNQNRYTMMDSNGLTINDVESSVAKPVARFSNEAKIGAWDGSQSYLKLDYRSLKLFDKGTNADAFFSVEDLRERVNNEQVANLTETFLVNASESEETKTATITGTAVIDQNRGYDINQEIVVDSNKKFAVTVQFNSSSITNQSTTENFTGDGITDSFDLNFYAKFVTSVSVAGTTMASDTYYFEENTLTFNEDYIPVEGASIVVTYQYKQYLNANIVDGSLLYVESGGEDVLVNVDLYIITAGAVYLLNSYTVLNTNYKTKVDSNIYETNYPIKTVSVVSVNGSVLESNKYGVIPDSTGIVFTESQDEDAVIRVTYAAWAYQPTVAVANIEPNERFELQNGLIVFKVVPTNEDIFVIRYRESPTSFRLKFTAKDIISVKRDGNNIAYEFNQSTNAVSPGSGVVLSTNDVIVINYSSESNLLKTFTFGFRDNQYLIGGLSTTFGYNTAATENYGVAEGYMTVSQGKQGAHAEGYNTHALSASSHTEGNSTETAGINAHAEGYNTIAGGRNSHAEGSASEAYEEGSHAEGVQTEASGVASHAEGFKTIATGDYSHAQNLGTIANGTAQTVLGQYNTTDRNALLIVGNGSGEDSRSSALHVYKSGNVQFFENVVLNYKKYLYLKDKNNASHSGLIMKDSGGDSYIVVGSSSCPIAICSNTTSNNGGILLTTGGYFYPAGAIRLKNSMSISGYKKNSISSYYHMLYLSDSNNVVLGDTSTNTIIRGKNKGAKNTYILNASGYLTLGAGISCGGSIGIPNGYTLYSYKKTGTTTYGIIGLNDENMVTVGNADLPLRLRGNAYSFSSATNFRHALSIGSDISIQSKELSIGSIGGNEYKSGNATFTYSADGHSYNGRCVVGWVFDGTGSSYFTLTGLRYVQSENKVYWNVRNNNSTSRTGITLWVWVLFTY